MALVILISMDVFLKYAFNAPIPGTAEIVASYFMVAVVFLALPYVESSNAHIHVDILSARLRPNYQRILEIVSCVATVVLYAIYGWTNLEAAIEAYVIGEYRPGVWNVTVWPSKFIIPLGVGAGILVLIVRVMRLGTSRLAPGGSLLKDAEPLPEGGAGWIA